MRAAVLLLFAGQAFAADDLLSAARELARKTAAVLGGRLSSETYRNRSSLPDSELDRVRREFRAAMPALDTGAANPNTEIRLTLSENATQYLLIEQLRIGEDSQNWIASWNRTASVLSASPVAVVLDRKLLWEQPEPILDLAFWDSGMLVLSPSRLAVYDRQGTQWSLRRQVAITLPHPLPRDPRGRFRRNGSHFELFLPGAACQGNTEPALSLECHPSSGPWVLESGSRALLLADFAPDRNYFDGRLVLQEGMRKTVSPFYSAAAAETPGGEVWLLAALDGQTQVLNTAFEPAGAIPSWGSDIVGLNGCGSSGQILATRPGDGSQLDAVQAFSIVNAAAVPASAPLLFPGTITALWPASPNSALAVANDAAERTFRAYLITPACN